MFDSAKPMNRQTTRLVPIAILCATWLLFLWGIQREMPYEPFIDEPIFVTRAIHMAATGDLNPHWFGNPGSTTIYPLAVYYHFWYAATNAGDFLHPNPGLATGFDADFTVYYLVGRLLTIAYGLLTVALTYRLGKAMWSERAGILASTFLIFHPTLVWHTTVVRTDTSAMFFVTLALWYCFRMLDQPRQRNFVLAGAAIGLALSSRYLMVSLYGVYLAFFLLAIPTWRRNGQLTQGIAGFVLGGVVSIAVFALTTPFFFLDWHTAWEDLLLEARTNHIGADGKNYWDRAFWYLTNAIPLSIYWGQMGAVVVAIGLGIWQRSWRVLVLALFVLMYVATVSVPTLFWKRWMIQLSPVLALLAAYGLGKIATTLAGRTSPRLEKGIVALLAVLLVAQPAFLSYQLAERNRSTSTRIEAREWMVENLPPSSRIITELYAAPLANTPFVVTQQPYLPERPFDDYLAGEFDYAITSSEISNRYLLEKERYASEIDFYVQLSKLPLVAEFVPTALQGGATIVIYKLPAQGATP